jgi:hypothetical protein
MWSRIVKGKSRQVNEPSSYPYSATCIRSEDGSPGARLKNKKRRTSEAALLRRLVGKKLHWFLQLKPGVTSCFSLLADACGRRFFGMETSFKKKED